MVIEIRHVLSSLFLSDLRNKCCIIKILFPRLNKYSELLISDTNPTVKIVLLLYGNIAKIFLNAQRINICLTNYDKIIQSYFTKIISKVIGKAMPGGK